MSWEVADEGVADCDGTGDCASVDDGADGCGGDDGGCGGTDEGCGGAEGGSCCVYEAGCSVADGIKGRRVERFLGW